MDAPKKKQKQNKETEPQPPAPSELDTLRAQILDLDARVKEIERHMFHEASRARISALLKKERV